MYLHKRDYALLRSVGLTPSGVNQLLLLEGLSFVIKPFVISLPVIMLICWFMLNLTLISWREFLSALKLGPILLYSGGVIASILIAYWQSAKIVKNGNIIEVIKNEIV